MMTFLSAFISWDGCENSVCANVCERGRESACCCLRALPVQGFFANGSDYTGSKGHGGKQVCYITLLLIVNCNTVL